MREPCVSPLNSRQSVAGSSLMEIRILFGMRSADGRGEPCVRPGKRHIWVWLFIGTDSIEAIASCANLVFARVNDVCGFGYLSEQVP